MTLLPLPRRIPCIATLASAMALSLLASLAGMALAVALLGVAGASIHPVLSDSMAPVFHRGDLIVTKRAAELRVGDTVTFRKYGALVTHRIVALGRLPGSFETRGDANLGNDPWTITAADVTGTLHGVVPRAGLLILAMDSSTGRLLAANLLVGLMAVLWWAVPRATRISPRLLHPSAGYAVV